jgi:hypothetical protein
MGEGEGSPRRLCVLKGVVDQESPGLTTAPFNRCMHGPVCAQLLPLRTIDHTHLQFFSGSAWCLSSIAPHFGVQVFTSASRNNAQGDRAIEEED